MKRTNRFEGRRDRVYEPVFNIQENLSLIAFGGFFLGGVFLGALVVSWLGSDAAESLTAIMGNFLQSRQQQDLPQTFLSAFSSSALLLLLLFFCGFCAISAPLIFAVPLFKGLGFGLTAGSVFAACGIDALWYVAILILPNPLISAIVLLLACRQAFRMSRKIWIQVTAGGAPRSAPAVAMGPFLGRFLIYLILIGAGAVIESILYHIFSPSLLLP